MFNFFLWIITELKKLRNSFNHKEADYEQKLEAGKDITKCKKPYLDILKKRKKETNNCNPD